MITNRLSAQQAIVTPAESQYSSSIKPGLNSAELDQEPYCPPENKCGDPWRVSRKNRWRVQVLGDKRQSEQAKASLEKLNKWRPPGRSPLGLPPLAALNSSPAIDDGVRAKSLLFSRVSQPDHEPYDHQQEFVEINLPLTNPVSEDHSSYVAAYLPTNRVSKYILATVSVASVLALAGFNLQQKNRGNAPLASQYSAPAAPSPWALAAGCLIFLTVSASLFIQSFSRPSSPIKPRDKTSSDRLPSCMIEL